MLKRQFKKITSKINEEYEDSKLRLKHKWRKKINDSNWKLNSNHNNLNIRNFEDSQNFEEVNSIDNSEGEDNQDEEDNLIDNISLEAIVLNDK